MRQIVWRRVAPVKRIHTDSLLPASAIGSLPILAWRMADWVRIVDAETYHPPAGRRLTRRRSWRSTRGVSP